MPRGTLEETSVKIDLHTHSAQYSGCSRLAPEALAREAVEAGLDAVALTEHNHAWDPADLAQLSAGGLLVLGGIEVTCREGDCLVLAPEVTDLPRGLGLEELAAEAHRRGGLAFLAHPFRTTLDQGRRYLSNPLDGLEQESCNNFGRLEREAAEEVAARGGLRLISASDAHAPDMVGCFYVELAEPVADVAGLLRALRRGAYRCGRNDRRFYAFLDARLAALRARVRSEVLSGTRELEALKRATGVSSDVIREVLAEAVGDGGGGGA